MYLSCSIGSSTIRALATCIPSSQDFWILNNLVPVYLFNLTSPYSLTSLTVTYLQVIFRPYGLLKNAYKIRLLNSLRKKKHTYTLGAYSHKAEIEQHPPILYGPWTLKFSVVSIVRHPQASLVACLILGSIHTYFGNSYEWWLQVLSGAGLPWFKFQL